MSSDQQQTLAPMDFVPVTGGETTEIAGGKKKCPNGSQRGSDGKCHKHSAKRSSSKKKSSKRKYTPRESTALGVCASASKSSCNYNPNCHWRSGSKKSPGRRAVKGMCVGRAGTRQNMSYAGPVFVPEGSRGSRMSDEEYNKIYGGRRRRRSHRMRGGETEEAALIGGADLEEMLLGGSTETTLEGGASELDGGALDAGKRGKKITTPIRKIQSRAKKLHVKASGSKARIMQRIRSAKKSKSAIRRRASTPTNKRRRSQRRSAKKSRRS